jgi:hypothetical protein
VNAIHGFIFFVIVMNLALSGKPIQNQKIQSRRRDRRPSLAFHELTPVKLKRRAGSLCTRAGNYSRNFTRSATKAKDYPPMKFPLAGITNFYDWELFSNFQPSESSVLSAASAL